MRSRSRVCALERDGRKQRLRLVEAQDFIATDNPRAARKSRSERY